MDTIKKYRATYVNFELIELFNVCEGFNFNYHCLPREQNNEQGRRVGLLNSKGRGVEIRVRRKVREVSARLGAYSQIHLHTTLSGH